MFCLADLTMYSCHQRTHHLLFLQACGFQFGLSLVVAVTARHDFFRRIRHDSELACVDSACRHFSHVILLCVDFTGDSMVLGMLLPLLCVVFVFGRLGAVEVIMGQVHAWMMATALDYGPCYEQGSSSIFVRDDGEPQIVANSLTQSFVLNLIGPLSHQQFKGVPVGSEPTLALKTMTCKKEVVWFPKFMTVQRNDVIEVTRYVLVAADGVKTEKNRPIIVA